MGKPVRAEHGFVKHGSRVPFLRFHPQYNRIICSGSGEMAEGMRHELDGGPNSVRMKSSNA